MSEQYAPAAFSAVLTDPSYPLIVGGQAVNLWAEIYASSEPTLQQFEPFTSKDADIHGDRALAEILHRRSGWTCQFFDEVRQPAVALLEKSGGASAYVSEIIRSADARTVRQRHGLYLTAIFPESFSASPHAKVRRFAEHQLPRLFPRRSAAK